jgi:hypothetical protein
MGSELSLPVRTFLITGLKKDGWLVAVAHVCHHNRKNG